MIFTKILLGALGAVVVAGGLAFAGETNAQGDQSSAPIAPINQNFQTGQIGDGEIGQEQKHRGPKKNRKHKKNRRNRKDHPKLTAEQRAALQQATEQSNYEAWKKILGDAPITKKITAENFPTFVEAMKLFKNGDKEAAQKIFKELGVKPPLHKVPRTAPQLPQQ